MTTNEFFRLRIEPGRTAQSGEPLSLSQVGTNEVKRAMNFLQNSLGSITNGTGDSDWVDAVLGPKVNPVYGAAFNNGQSPAYLEFKVVRNTNSTDASPPRGDFLKTPPSETLTDEGFILISLVHSDFPVAEFATRGPTAVERLQKLAGTPDIKAFRYGGGTVWVAEDLQGNLVANWGGQPFRPPTNIVAFGRQAPTYIGDDSTGLNNPPPTNHLIASFYSSYPEFKTDYLTNPTYVYLRNRQTQMASGEWMLEDGQMPQTLTVPVGGRITILTNETVLGFFQDTADGDQDFASIAVGKLGLSITGKATGSGMLDVRTSTGDHMYALEVTATGALLPQNIFVPHWGPFHATYAGSWDTEPKYHQLQRDEFCRDVGCGPNAWAIYFAWVQRNQGLRPLFGWFNTTPPADSDGPANESIILPVDRDFFQECNVICSPTSDEGATLPGDMMAAGPAQTFISAVVFQYTVRTYKMRWTLLDSCPEDGALHCRNAIKKGYPGVVGLGWLWHYAVAYGYEYQQYYLAPNVPYLTARYLKCNMGWGDDPPRWYNLCDTFFSSDFHVTKGPKGP
jgi:hypothetical protein